MPAKRNAKKGGPKLAKAVPKAGQKVVDVPRDGAGRATRARGAVGNDAGPRAQEDREAQIAELRTQLLALEEASPGDEPVVMGTTNKAPTAKGAKGAQKKGKKSSEDEETEEGNDLGVDPLELRRVRNIDEREIQATKSQAKGFNRRKDPSLLFYRLGLDGVVTGLDVTPDWLNRQSEDQAKRGLLPILPIGEGDVSTLVMSMDALTCPFMRDPEAMKRAGDGKMTLSDFLKDGRQVKTLDDLGRALTSCEVVLMYLSGCAEAKGLRTAPNGWVTKAISTDSWTEGEVVYRAVGAFESVMAVVACQPVVRQGSTSPFRVPATVYDFIVRHLGDGTRPACAGLGDLSTCLLQPYSQGDHNRWSAYRDTLPREHQPPPNPERQTPKQKKERREKRKREGAGNGGGGGGGPDPKKTNQGAGGGGSQGAGGGGGNKSAGRGKSLCYAHVIDTILGTDTKLCDRGTSCRFEHRALARGEADGLKASNVFGGLEEDDKKKVLENLE